MDTLAMKRERSLQGKSLNSHSAKAHNSSQACKSDAGCASGFCGFNSGKCAGPVVAQERDGGCGFGDPTPNANAANALIGGAPMATSPACCCTCNGSAANGSSAAINNNLPGVANGDNGVGKQFITGQCLNDVDCASGCCGLNSGLCAGAIIAWWWMWIRDASPNDNAAQALTGSGASAPAATAAAGAGSDNGCRS
ncbi:uncharacterized protein Z518_01505 [Rhinocladiella mackenziei CBS 650.93]|uniref:Uncharacterized protein n=1 Tax=Rhinocladiella mackenziei CBS 650.93 TaxID=1442369 RepID=A0A0D2HIC3_9EURO|nr:uncharacterized protein Z518_01505 [Rhinocladiella mackenziei CBS 650.93]KIX10423.1 hypothetical protein Z518_01505 [Rhinocladiella mackenziei CBS 650.93]